MAKAKEVTVEDKLRALYDLQLIDSRIDKIRNVRGELPLEVEDLEDEIAGLETRVGKLNDEVAELDAEIKGKKNLIKESQERSKNTRASKRTFATTVNLMPFPRRSSSSNWRSNWPKSVSRNSKPR